MNRFRPLHWTARFFTSIRPGRPAAEDEAWARGLLTEREADLFGRMSNPDRRHAVAVAREVDRSLPAGTERRDTVLAAALLHDIGKTVSGLRSYGRVIATLSGAVVGGRVFAEFWQDSSGFTRKVGLYMRYPILGAEMLEIAQSDPWVIAWAREHHEPEDDWTVPVDIFRTVVAADR
jgi:hypothetical protein